MPQGKDIEIFLQDKLNRFWQINEAGEVLLSANPKPIQFAPDGWQELGIKNILNTKYFALDRTVTIPFKYTEDGAKILKHVFYKIGSEETVYLTICEQQLDYEAGVNYGYWYKQRFKGEIDFTTFDHDGATVTANSLEEGLAKHMRANENEAYEFDLAGAEKVKMDGIIIDNKFSWIMPADPQVGGQHIRTMVLSGQEQLHPSVAAFTVNGGGLYNPNTITVNDTTFCAYFSSAPIGGTATIEGIIRMSAPNPSFPVNARLDIFNVLSGTQRVNNELLFIGPEAAEITINHPFTVLPGDRIFISVDEAMGESQLSLTAKTRFEATYIPFLRPQYLFSEFINRMTGGAYSAEDCPYFGAIQNIDKVFTSGDGIRGIAGAKLKMSFNDFFGFFDTWDSVGIREKQGKVLFDRKKNLINFSNILDLGEVSRPKIKFNKDFGFNQLAIGYKDEKNENGLANGKNEFNTTFNFSLGTTKNPRKLEKISPIQGSCYAIEGIRVDTFLKDTTDNKGDNQSYVLHVEKTLIVTSDGNPNHYKLNRDRNAFLTGVDQADTIFNAGISPKTCFINSGDFLHSCLYKMDNRTFKFGTADRNTEMAYINGADVIIEKADVPVNTLGDKFFVPIDISIETDAPVDLLDILDIDPLLIMEATCAGMTLRGLPQEVSISPKTGKIQTYKLLATADCDLEPMIEYYG